MPSFEIGPPNQLTIDRHRVLVNQIGDSFWRAPGAGLDIVSGLEGVDSEVEGAAHHGLSITGRH